MLMFRFFKRLLRVWLGDFTFHFIASVLATKDVASQRTLKIAELDCIVLPFCGSSLVCALTSSDFLHQSLTPVDYFQDFFPLQIFSHQEGSFMLSLRFSASYFFEFWLNDVSLPLIYCRSRFPP